MMLMFNREHLTSSAVSAVNLGAKNEDKVKQERKPLDQHKENVQRRRNFEENSESSRIEKDDL